MPSCSVTWQARHLVQSRDQAAILFRHVARPLSCSYTWQGRHLFQTRGQHVILFRHVARPPSCLAPLFKPSVGRRHWGYRSGRAVLRTAGAGGRDGQPAELPTPYVHCTLIKIRRQQNQCCGSHHNIWLTRIR